MAKKEKIIPARKKSNLDEKLDEMFPELELLKADGFDDCVIGIAERFGQDPIIAYDKDKVIESLMKQGMSYEEAIEFFDFNIIGAWVGEKTPTYIQKL